MTQKIKTGLCVLALLLAILAAYVQEMSCRQSADLGSGARQGPFATVVQTGPGR